MKRVAEDHASAHHGLAQAAQFACDRAHQEPASANEPQLAHASSDSEGIDAPRTPDAGRRRAAAAGEVINRATKLRA